METSFAKSSPDQSFSAAYKQFKNPKKNSRAFISKPSENNMQRGLLLAPPLLYSSYPPSLFSLHNYQQQQQQQQQPPPLLPLPIPNKTLTHHSSLPSRSRNLSCPPSNSPPSNRKSYRTRDKSVTPKKAKQPTKRSEDPKLEIFRPVENTVATQAISSEAFILTSVNHPLGPDPNDLPKDVSKVFSAGIVAVKDFEKFSVSAFTLSPPPSSLPLPKFSLRPKLISCNAEAGGIDAGATDNLRRMLRLR